MGGRKKMFKKEINYFAMVFFEVDLFVPASSNTGCCLQSFHPDAGSSHWGAVIGVHM